MRRNNTGVRLCRLSFHATETQLRLLSKLAAATGLGASEHLRRALDLYLPVAVKQLEAQHAQAHTRPYTTTEE